MRMGPRVGLSAGEMLEQFSEEELSRVLRDYGELHNTRRLAQAILRARDERKLETTADLARVIESASGGRKMSSIHPATRAFQAIRIAVNRELEELEKLLQALPALVAPGGRVAIISFHSLEDRLVKHAFRDPEPEPLPPGFPVEPEVVLGPFTSLTKKPITPSNAELTANPRSRSAKLRVAERRQEGTSR
jgi:16S rRNA (cytosine1402-N4)-methyltransferase